jgi:hypothetical protein
MVPWPPWRIELRGAAPFPAGRFAFDDAGGVKVCQPGRALFTEPRDVVELGRFSAAG